MHNNTKILVVGTTPDYVDWIQKACPGRALFLTDLRTRKVALQFAPAVDEELMVDLDDFELVIKVIMVHLQQWDQTICAIVCFDCEYMELTSKIASQLGLEYPDLSAIQNCRDKYISKILWQKNGIACPQVLPVNELSDVLEFFGDSKDGIVLKPFYGSGSELVFRCSTPKECKTAFSIIKRELNKRQTALLFKKSSSREHLMLAESFVTGPEFSCDFILEENVFRIIRMTRKIKPSGQPFGTVSGYVLSPDYSRYVDAEKLEACLRDAAHCLGISRGICMVDFIIDNKKPILIEMTPRPGGDCLPFLLKEAGNIDIISLTLDFAEKKPLPLNGQSQLKPYVGLRIHAHRAGVLKSIDISQLATEKRIKKIHLIRNPGHVITMPPKDYDSWLLGHIILQPDENSFPETQCVLIAKRLGVQIDS